MTLAGLLWAIFIGNLIDYEDLPTVDSRYRTNFEPRSRPERLYK